MFIISLKVFANFDLSVGTGARTYPGFGFEGFGEIGYNQLLYGDAPGKGIFYGLIRPSLRLASSAVINSYDAKLEVYPISIIGFAAGHRFIKADFEDFPAFDCDEIRCSGELKKDYVHMRAVLGFGPIVAIGMVEESRNSYNDPSGEGLPVAEFRFAIRANAESDENTRSQYILGYRLDRDMIAAITEYVYYKESEQFHKLNLLGYISQGERSNITYGLGTFESSDTNISAVGVIRFIYRFTPNYKLF